MKKFETCIEFNAQSIREEAEKYLKNHYINDILDNIISTIIKECQIGKTSWFFDCSEWSNNREICKEIKEYLEKKGFTVRFLKITWGSNAYEMKVSC